MDTATDDNLLARLRGRKSHLSPALMKVADYVISHPQKVIHQNLVELADCSGASEASVVRYCRDAGCNSFADFKIALSISLLKESPDQRVQPQDDVQDSLAMTISSLNDTASLMDRGELSRAATIMKNANRIHLFGVGASQVIAQYGEYRMMRLGQNTRSLPDMHSAVMTISCMDKNDVLILVSGSGSTFDVIKTAQLARERKVPIIAITGDTRGELAQLATICLQTAVPESPFSAGAFFSKAAQMFVIDLLANTMLEQHSELQKPVARTAESIVISGLAQSAKR